MSAKSSAGGLFLRSSCPLIAVGPPVGRVRGEHPERVPGGRFQLSSHPSSEDPLTLCCTGSANQSDEVFAGGGQEVVHVLLARVGCSTSRSPSPSSWPPPPLRLHSTALLRRPLQLPHAGWSSMALAVFRVEDMNCLGSRATVLWSSQGAYCQREASLQN